MKKLKNTQTFIVTHETNLLKTSIVRPDQVYIVDYNENGSFISKASDQSPRESQNLEKMYLAGVFGGIPLYDFKDLLYKLAILFGALLVIYGVLWLLAELHIIPGIIFAVFPQIVLILIGIFIMYVAFSKRKSY